MYQRIRRFLLSSTERQGRLRGADPAVFDESSITTQELALPCGPYPFDPRFTDQPGFAHLH